MSDGLRFWKQLEVSVGGNYIDEELLSETAESGSSLIFQMVLKRDHSVSIHGLFKVFLKYFIALEEHKFFNLPL